MPAYNSTNPPYAIYPGDSAIVQNAADGTAGTAPFVAGFRTQQIAIGRRDGESLSPYTVQIVFSGAPGAVEADVCESDIDTAGSYIEAVSGNMTTVDNSQAVNPVARFTANSSSARFVTVIWKTAPANAVSATITIHR